MDYDPVRGLIRDFHNGRTIDELCRVYDLDRPLVEGILRMCMNLNRRAMLRYTARDPERAEYIAAK